MGKQNKRPPKGKRHFLSRHKHFKHILIGLLVIIIVLSGLYIYSKEKVARQQSALAPFYNTSGLSLSGPMGQVVRSEPVNTSATNGSAVRVLYRTQRADGSVTFSGGLVFIPNNSNAGTPRPVVAWAHGTIGMGDACAPSRTPDPASNIGWVSQMLANGWVVTATDYAGLGTPGIEGFLVGGDEARDVLNSVRAAENIQSAKAGTTFAVWGHSQGGNSALFTAAEAGAYAPELHLVGTVASAPAAELLPLLSETYGTSLDWIIGPEVMVSWPTVYPGLNVAAATTNAGYKNYQRMARQCIATTALGGLVRNKVKQAFFKANLAGVPAWRNAAQDQTPPLPTPAQPVLIAESLADQVVLPNTTALYIQRACQAGSNVTTLWLADVGHIQLSSTIAPDVTSWINDRFTGRPTTPTCYQPLPLTPATVPSGG